MEAGSEQLQDKNAQGGQRGEKTNTKHEQEH